MSQLALLPAIDIAGGALARAPRGRDALHPAEAARLFARSGAAWIHLADLDLAFGTGSNDTLLAEIVRGAQDLGVRTQCSGGIDSPDALTTALATGCARVNVHPRGSEDPIGELTDILAFLNDAGCARIIVTEVDRDGALSGPPVALLESVSRATDAELIASGGIANLKDIEDLARLAGHTRVAGAIVGRALLDGRFGLAEALACVQRAENEGAEQPSERKK